MKLQALPLGATLLSSNLKVGLLAGIVGVAASTGAVATSTNSFTLSSAFNTVYDPVKGFFSTNIDPHFKKVYAGAEKIGGQLKSWTSIAYSKKDGVLTWIKTNFDSSIFKSGFQKIADKTKEWGQKTQNILSSTYSTGKTTVLPFLLNSESMRGLLYHGSEATNILKALGALLTASALSSLGGEQGSNSGGEEEDDEDDEAVNTPHVSKFWQLVTNPNFSSIVSSVWSLISDNLPIVKTLDKEQINKIVNFVLGSPDQVETRINEMKNPKQQKDKEDSPKWGSYKDASEFMNALFPPEDVAKAILSVLQTMAEGDDMSQYVQDQNKTIPSNIVEKILSCKSTGEENEKCPANATIATVLTKFLESIVSGSTAATQVQE